MSDLRPGMHDDPRLFPLLPPGEPQEIAEWVVHNHPEDSPWRTCWEFVLTHDLTPSEGSAFWHGANLAHRAVADALDMHWVDEPTP